MSQKIAVAYGDGIGPEIMESCLILLKEVGADISVETIDIGRKYYEMGNNTGIPESVWSILKNCGILLKAPITTPQGGGYKSLNVTLRKTLGLFSNVRPCKSYYPIVKTKCENMDMVIVRENEEDLYAGIEYRLTPNVYHAIKLISRSGCENIVRYAFEYAANNNRKKVTCMSKDNIMKMCDGVFHKIFDEVAKEYPKIESEHYIIDIGAARIASKPEIFDVVVTENLYGDIISDIAAEVSGSVGLAGSANIGQDFAMFEAIHGSAPDIAGQNIANPSGLLQAAVMMLVHIGQSKSAEKLSNALMKTLEDGMHTADIFDKKNNSKERLGTKEFTQAVVERMGQKPDILAKADFSSAKKINIGKKSLPKIDKDQTLKGVDLFIAWEDDVNQLGDSLKENSSDKLMIELISVRGLKIWPKSNNKFSKSDQYRCRFYAKSEIDGREIINLMNRLYENDINVLKLEKLFDFADGGRGYSLAQGE